MASLRELMKLEKRRRAESSQTPINSQITQSTTDDESNILINDDNSKVKRVSFSDEPIITQIEQEVSQLYIEPKLIHEEYFIEDFHNNSPLYTDTTNVDDDESSLTSNNLLTGDNLLTSDNLFASNTQSTSNTQLVTPNRKVDMMNYGLTGESAILAKIRQDKEKWLKIAGIESFDYAELDNQTSLLTNNIINTNNGRNYCNNGFNNNVNDINDIIKMKIDQAVGQSSASIVSSNFEVSNANDLKTSVANLPVGFFDDKNLDSQARGEATKDEAIEQLKNLAKLEKIITCQDILTPDKKTDDDLELNKLECNELLKSLLKQKEIFSATGNHTADCSMLEDPKSSDFSRNDFSSKESSRKGRREQETDRSSALDDDFELDWRARNIKF